MLILVKGLNPIPPGREFFLPDPDKIEEGTVVLEGEAGFALAGCFGDFDTEFVLLADGTAVWNISAFRGLMGPVRLVKLGDKLVFEAPAPPSAPPTP